MKETISHVEMTTIGLNTKIKIKTQQQIYSRTKDLDNRSRMR